MAVVPDRILSIKKSTHERKMLGVGAGLKIENELLDLTIDVLPDFTNNAATAINKGDAVYISGNDEVTLADASALSTSCVVGCVFDATIAGSGGTGNILTHGLLTGAGSGWTAGGKVYLSATGTTGNTLTQTPPTGDDEVQVVIGIAKNATDLLVGTNPIAYEVD